MSSPAPEILRSITALLAIMGSLLTTAVCALPEDAQQPIHISADRALHNEKAGLTVYNGNVEMEQGSLRISADKITIYRIDGEADKIVARGRPAQMQQQPDPDKGLVQARAGVIEYYKTESRIHLRQDAQIEQEGSTVTGDTIDYYIDEQLVKAGSSKSGEDSRVEVVIEAQALKKSEDDSGATDSK